MGRFAVLVLVLLVGIGVLGYWRGWFNVSDKGNVDVDRQKFEQDRAAFSKTVAEKASELKESLAKLWKKAKTANADKSGIQKELAELEKKHDRLQAQLQELEQAGAERFETLKEDVTRELREVDRRIEELRKKVEEKKDA